MFSEQTMMLLEGAALGTVFLSLVFRRQLARRNPRMTSLKEQVALGLAIVLMVVARHNLASGSVASDVAAVGTSVMVLGVSWVGYQRLAREIEPLRLWIPPALGEALRQRAAQHGQTVNETVVALLSGNAAPHAAVRLPAHRPDTAP